MRFDELIRYTNFLQVIGQTKHKHDIRDMTIRAENAHNDSLYFAITGTKHDGHDFIPEAIQRGCKCFVVSKPQILPADCVQVVVEDVRKYMPMLASKFYMHPEKQLKLIGVTGTNGKTTTTYMLQGILEQAGHKVGVIGTNGAKIGKKVIWSGLTTPDPIDLFGILRTMADAKVDVVAMEVSAHALDLHKIYGLQFDVAIFTNLTQDHLDYFHTMEAYGQAKAQLFTPEYAKVGVVNIDDDFGKHLDAISEIPILTTSMRGPAHIQGEVGQVQEAKQTFTASVAGLPLSFTLPMLGDYNEMNALGAIAATSILGVPLECAQKGLEHMPNVEGRFDAIPLGNHGLAIIDYAHTPDGLQHILESVRLFCKGSVISVFGCGGNRDVGKRPIMGEISSKLADFTIITSDNPRYENPAEIILQIEEGMAQTNAHNYTKLVNREDAIELAVRMAKKEDVVVISGKGAENYMDAMGKKTPYSDYQSVERALDALYEKNVKK